MYKQNFIDTMEIPKIEKIIIHTSSKKMIFDKKYLSSATYATELITLQKPLSIFSKKPSAAFNLRKNQTIGETVTLSKSRSFFNYLEKLIFLVYPNYKEFRGWNQIDNYRASPSGRHNQGDSFINFSAFPETKSFYQYFDFLAGFDISIKMVGRHQRQRRRAIYHRRQIPRDKLANFCAPKIPANSPEFPVKLFLPSAQREVKGDCTYRLPPRRVEPPERGSEKECTMREEFPKVQDVQSKVGHWSRLAGDRCRIVVW